MKQKFFFIAALLLSIWLAPSAGAQTFSYHIAQGQDVTFNVNFNNTTVSLSGYTQCVGHLVIPSTVTNNGTTYTVTSISNRVFENCSTLTAVTIPSSITSIGESSFASPSLTVVNYNAVSSNIYGVSSYYEIPPIYGASPFFSIYEYNDQSTGDPLYDTICAPITTLNIGNSVRVIPAYLMSGIPTLTSISIPTSVDTIGVCAFFGTGITTITIPNNVKNIGAGAFACSSLTTVNYNAVRATISTNSYSFSPFSYVYYYYDSIYNQINVTLRAPITAMNIGGNVRVIPSYLMSGISALTTTSLPISIDTIGQYAFDRTGITSVTIPDSVRYIGTSAFACPHLATVNYNAVHCTVGGINYNGQPAWIFQSFNNLRFDPSIGGYVYDYDTIRAPITTLNIGSGVRVIPAYLMSDISTLTTTSIPALVDTIGNYAFKGTGITSITIPNSVRYIGTSAFACPHLATVNYNAVACTIGGASYNDPWERRIFDDAPITTLNIGNSVRVIPANLMYGDSSLTSITIPASVDTICENAFAGTGLTTLTVPTTVKAIGDGAFCCLNLSTVHYNARRAVAGRSGDSWNYGYMGMFGFSYHYYNSYVEYRAPVVNLTIGDSVQYIPPYFLYSDTMLTSVVLPASVRHIDAYAFKYTRLTSVTIPANMDTIGQGAFECPTLASVYYNATNAYTSDCPFNRYVSDEYEYTNLPQTLTIGSNVRVLPDEVFRDMNISSVVLPDSLQSIGNECFQNTRLTSIIIPDLVTSIGSYAFASYDSEEGFGGVLRRVVIGSSVSSIGTYAFGGITNPDTIFVRATLPPAITNHTFEAMPTNAVIILPCGTTQSYQNASYWNSFTRMGEDPSCYNLVTVQTNNAAMGTVSGGGRYSTGQVATLSAMPRYNHAFAGWVDGSVDNPRLVLVSGDASYTANFLPGGGGSIIHDTVIEHHTDTIIVDHYDTIYVGGTDTIYIHDTVFIIHRDTVNIVDYDDGIDDVLGGGNALIYCNGNQIVIEGTEGLPVRLYDSVGRLLATKQENSGVVSFDVPVSGTYLVRIGKYPARRVVVVR